MKRLAAIALVLVTLPSVASADSFSGTFAGTGLGSSVQGVVQGTAFNVFAGQIRWDTGLDELLTTFCVDLKTPLVYQQDFQTSSTIFTEAKRASISYLVATNFTSLSSNWMAAGLQLAIWNVLYDTDYSVNNVSGATFYTTSNADASKWANTFLAALSTAASKGPLTGNAVFLDVKRGQDQVTYSTPEPGTLLLLGAGALALAARRRFARRAN